MNRIIRQRSHLKYSKHGNFNWDKWTEHDGIFCSLVDLNGFQKHRIELHPKLNSKDPNSKIVDLKLLRSITCLHGDVEKHEPNDIIILKIDKKRYRFGFDDAYEYNQWKMLLDEVYNSATDLRNKERIREDSNVNMFHKPTNAIRYKVQFADLETQDILCLPADECHLILDTEKLVLEQRNVREYTFPRAVIRRVNLLNDSDIELELGPRAPLQGCIRFHFLSPLDARSCYLKWNEGFATPETKYREPGERLSPNRNSPKPGYVLYPQQNMLDQQYSPQPPARKPRNQLINNQYHDIKSSISSPNYSSQNQYVALHTLV